MRNLLTYARTHWALISAVLSGLWLLVLRLYYWAKPWLPRRVRLGLRRWLARKVRRTSGHEWPILESAGTKPPFWPGWPGDRNFAVVLTHDVESQKGLDRVKDLAEVDMAMGFRSSFNFVPEGTYRASDELRQWLVKRGFEVGVHDHRHDGKLYQTWKGFMSSAGRINHFLRQWNAVGFRAGFMFHNLEWIHQLNVAYDSSTFDTDPFEPQASGAGTIFPFRVADENGRGYVELPYTLVQDSTLFVILQEKSADIWQHKFQWIASRGGMALLNVHPDYIAFDGREPETDEFPLDRYAGFLRWIRRNYEGQYWQALPRQVAEFCSEQSPAVIIPNAEPAGRYWPSDGPVPAGAAAFAAGARRGMLPSASG